MLNEKLLKGISVEEQIYGRLFTLTNRIQTFGDEVFPDITLKQHFLLIIVSLFKDAPPVLKEAAEIAGCSYQNVKKIAIILEKKGYLKILKDDEDKRKNRLVLTEKIEKISSCLEKETNDFFRLLFNGISPGQKNNLLSAIIQMDMNLLTDNKKNK